MMLELENCFKDWLNLWRLLWWVFDLPESALLAVTRFVCITLPGKYWIMINI